LVPSRLVPANQLAETWRGIAVIQDPHFRWLFAPSAMREYGLGWFTFLHRDQRVILHGGNIDGMSALVSFIPEKRIGVVALSNMNQSFVHLGVTRCI
jgi:CubicO group peptidase (beta-lactamase class C family)